MRALLIPALIGLAALGSADQTKRLDPKEVTRLRPGEICRYFRVSGGHNGKRLYQSLVVVRKDYTVICKGPDFASSFKMNDAQRESWNRAYKLFDFKRLVEGKRTEKTLPSMEDGGTDYYISLRKDGKTYQADNVRFKMGYVFIVDNLEVYYYLERPKDKDGIPKPPA